MGAGCSAVLGDSGRDGTNGRREQELKTAELGSMLWMEEAEGADAVKAFGGCVLKEATQELVGRERHGPGSRLARRSIAEGDGGLDGEDGLVGHRGAVDVAAEVGEDLAGAARDGLGEDDPALAPRQMRERDGRQGAAGEVKEASAKELCEGDDRDQEHGLATRDGAPGAPVRVEPAAGDEHVDVRVPFERARPGMEDGERADAATDEARIGAEPLERVECSTKEDGEQDLLMRPDEASKLGGEGEDEVEVRDRKEQLFLSAEPARGGVETALGAGAVSTGMVEQVGAVALGTRRQVAAHFGGPAEGDVLERADVAGQHGAAVAVQVTRAVPTHDVGDA